MIAAQTLKGHVVFPTDDLSRFNTVFPELRSGLVNGKLLAAVPHTLESARVLRNMGVNAPSTIRTEYNFPIMAGRTPGWWQIDTAEFLTLNPRAFVLNAMRCVDAETEFLTPTGWKRIDQYTQGDLVAQWNKDTDQAEFVQPLEYIKTPCTEMIHFKTSKGVDQMLTPEHRMVYQNCAGEICETTARAVHDRNTDTKKGWRGKLPVTFQAPTREGIDLTDAQIRIMVATMADGYFVSRSGCRCQVRIKKERKKERLRELLIVAGTEWTERTKDYPTAKGFTVFQYYAPRREKEFTAYWWDATTHQLQVILEESQHWDSAMIRDKGSFIFASRVKTSADFIQYAAVATKRKASCRTRVYLRDGVPETDYAVYVQTSGGPISIQSMTSDGQKRITSTVVGPPPDGMCYCFEVPSSYLIFRRNGSVFISGNTRKTLSTLWAMDYLQKKRIVGKTLIVAPLSTLERVWGDHLFFNFPRKRFAVLHGSAKKRLELLDKDYDAYIINHDGLGIIAEELGRRTDINLIIIDELAVYRGSQTNRWKVMKKLVTPERMCWGLTGTPTPNEPTDAYGQMKIIKPENYTGHFTRFKNDVMAQIGPFKWVPRKGSEDIVKRVLSPSIRFTRDVVTDMEPTLIERHAEMSEQQKHHFNKLLREAATEIDGTQINAVNAAVLIQKLVQAGSGVVYGSKGEVVELDFGPRLKVLEELIEENEEKVLVFVPFTGVLDALARELSKKWSVAVVDGGVSSHARNKIFYDFQNAKSPHIIVAHPGTMAHGLELTAASLIIWYAPCNRNETYEQACARIDGGGQKVKIDIAHISASATERRIYSVLREKGRLQQVVLELMKGNSR